MKIVFIAIVLAAAAIVTIKLTGNSGVNENQVTTPTEKSCCGGDTTKKCSGDTTKVCDPQKESSCCPGNKK